jgi:ankyrin repeat protein
MRAALFGPIEAMKEVDLSAVTADGTSVLMMAAHDPAKVKVLVDRGAPVTHAARNGVNAVIVASSYRHNAETLRTLLDGGAAANAGKGVMFNASPLVMATMAGDRAMVETLLKAGADVERPMMIVGMFPATPMALAAAWDEPELIGVLAAAGADFDRKDAMGMTPLAMAMLGHRERAARKLLELGASTGTADKQGLTPIEHATLIDFDDPTFAQRLVAKQ